MRILVATHETQGLKPGDFCWTKESEIVTFPVMCDNSCTCGCNRSMAGIESHKATTTFKVVESPIRWRDYHIALLKSLVNGGWYEKMTRDAINHAREMAVELIKTAEFFPVNTVLELKGSSVRVRKAA